MTERRRILLAEVKPRIIKAPVYATWNPADRDASITLSVGNLTATKSTTHATQWGGVRGNTTMPAGQWYWETTVAFSGAADFAVGLSTDGSNLALEPAVRVNRAGSVAVYGAVAGSVGAATTGDVIRVWLDADAFVLRIARNGGAWVVVANSNALQQVVTNQNGSFPVASFLRPAGATASATANFGATPFLYAVPDGCNAGVYTVPPSEPTTLYLGSEGFYGTRAGGTVHYMGRIASDQDVEIEREGSCWVWGGQTISRPGQVVCVNADGGLDGWANLDWRNAPVTLLRGYAGDTLDLFREHSTGLVDRIEFTSDRRVILPLADPLAQADVPLQSEVYPEDFANTQVAGTPIPIVLGTPKFVPGVLQDTLTVGSNARARQLHDGRGGQGITLGDVYDNGSRFAAPGDPYTASSPITAANGGNLAPWAGTPSVPSGWSAITPITATNGFATLGTFSPGARCYSDGSAYAVLISNASFMAAGRYLITFNVATVTKAGTLRFRVDGGGGVRSDTSVAITAAGAKSVTLDVRKAGQLQLAVGNLTGPDLGIDITINTLRMDSQQVTDWTVWPATGTQTGFRLDNASVGKVTAHPIDATYGSLTYAVASVANRVGLGINTGGLGIGTMPIGDYLAQPVTALAQMRALLDAVLATVVPDRTGALRAARIVEPSRTAVAALDTTNVRDTPVVTLDEAKNLTTVLCGQRNFTVHSPTEVATSVSDPNSPTFDPVLLARLTCEWGVTCAGAPKLAAAVADAYAHAEKAKPRGTVLQDAAQIKAEISRICTIWRRRRAFYAVQALLDEHADLEPGDTVRLTWPGFGLDAGKNLLVVGVRSRFFARRVDLKLWG